MSGTKGTSAAALVGHTHPSEVSSGRGRFQVWIVFPDGNPAPVVRHESLMAALKWQWDEQARRSGQSCCVFVTDRDNEERGQLSDLDLDAYGEDA